MKITNKKIWIRVSALLLSLVILSMSTVPSQATKTVDEMESELSVMNKELNHVRKQIRETSDRLKKTKEELAITKGMEETQYESMMLRIKYMYENGNTGLLELMLTSTSWAEFVNRAEYVSQITAHDRELLNELIETREEITKKEAELLEDQKHLASLQKDLSQKISKASDELSDYKAKLQKALEEAKKAEEEAKKEVVPVKPEKEPPKKDSESTSKEPSISATASDIELLAALLECEAGSSNYEALLAVGSVVVNRMKNRHYPNTVRGVIYQSGQFPPAHDGKVDCILARGVKSLCVKAATDALNGKNNVGDCLSFRASSSGRPGLVIGDNVFF